MQLSLQKEDADMKYDKVVAITRKKAGRKRKWQKKRYRQCWKMENESL